MKAFINTPTEGSRKHDHESTCAPENFELEKLGPIQTQQEIQSISAPSYGLHRPIHGFCEKGSDMTFPSRIAAELAFHAHWPAKTKKS